MKHIFPLILVVLCSFLQVIVYAEQANLKTPGYSDGPPKSSGSVSDVRALIKGLSSSDPAAQIKAARELAKVGQNATPAIPHLIRMLGDTAYVALFDGPKPSFPTSPARQAMTVLIALGNPATDPLVRALKDGNSTVRKNAAEALGLMGNTQALNPLVEALSDEDMDVRKAAVGSLGRLNDPRAAAHILGALKDNKSSVRSAAFDSLNKLAVALRDKRDVKTLGTILRCQDLSVRRMAIEMLSDIPETQSAEMLTPLLGDSDSRIRDSAKESLKKIGIPSVESLITELNDGDVGTRVIAAELLGEFKDKRAVEPLLTALNFYTQDQQLDAAKLRLEAAEALGKIGDVRALGHLLTALRDENPQVRERVRRALKSIGKEVVEPLNKTLMEPDSNMRIYAAIILGDIADPASAQSLIKALLLDAGENGSWLFRFEAIRALGKIGDPSALEPLDILLGDRVSQVREIARWAIEQIKERKVERGKHS